MIKLFEFLLDGCWHHWGDANQYRVKDTDGTIIGFAIIQECKKCGKCKRTNLF